MFRLMKKAILTTMWVVLAGTSAVEFYDEVPTPNADLMYQGENTINAVDHEDPGLEEQIVKDLLLYKLIKSMQRGTYHNLYFKPWTTEKDNPYGYNETDLKPKEGFTKRLPGMTSLNKPSTRVQQKWKTKKGKAVGSQMVCYFKLCAFRSPA